MTAAAAWNFLVPAAQTTEPVKAFLSKHGLEADNTWIIQEEAIPLRPLAAVCHQGRASCTSGVYHQDRAPSIPEVCHHGRASSIPEVCHQDRASSIPEVCQCDRAPSISGLCHRDGSLLPPPGLDASSESPPKPPKPGQLQLPDPWSDSMEVIGRSQIGGSWVREGTIKTSAIFHGGSDLAGAFRNFPTSLVAWLRLEDASNGRCLDCRPFPLTTTDWSSTIEGPVRCTLWVLTPRLHWLAGWVDHLGNIIKLDPGLECEGWAFQSVSLTESLGEEEGREIPVKGHASELKRCGSYLTSIVKKKNREAGDRVDFAELFSPHLEWLQRPESMDGLWNPRSLI